MKLIQLQGIDPGTPPYCTFDKQYFGTEKDVEEYQKDNTELNVVREVIAKNYNKKTVENFKYIHTNIWGYEYIFFADEATIETITVNDAELIKVSMTNPKLESELSEETSIILSAKTCWGNPGVFYDDGNRMVCRFYMAGGLKEICNEIVADG